jgi:hypothetical protein
MAIHPSNQHSILNPKGKDGKFPTPTLLKTANQKEKEKKKTFLH